MVSNFRSDSTGLNVTVFFFMEQEIICCLHQTVWALYSRVKYLHGIHGFPWKILHGIPWRIRTSISMEFHGNFSIDFHGRYLHGGLGHFQWNSKENIRAPISMGFHGNLCIDIFHGGLGHFLWNSMEKFHAIP